MAGVRDVDIKKEKISVENAEMRIGFMKRQIIAAMLALAFVAGAVPASMELQDTFTAEAAKKKTPSVKKIRKAVIEAYGEDYHANYSLTSEEINQRYGLSSKWYTDAAADVPMISANVDTFLAVKAKNAKAKKKIKAKLEDYQYEQINTALQYPMNLLKFQASKIYTKGDYVFFIMLGSISNEMEETATEEEQIEAFKEKNQLAVDTIKELFAK